MADLKTKAGIGDVAAFIEGLEGGSRQADALALVGLMSRVTGEPAVLWGPSMVGFGAYHYRYDSGHEGDSFRVGFSPRKTNLVLYLPGRTEEVELMEKLGKHTTGKGCLYLKRLADVDLAVLEELITRSFKEMAIRYPA